MKHNLQRAHEARMKHAIAEATGLISILNGISAGNRPIDDMNEARGLLAKLNQSLHEASAYHSAHKTMKENSDFIPLGNERQKKFRRKILRQANQ